MIINLSDLIFKLAQLVTGQSVAADEYIQQRSISTERVVDPYLLITRAITPPNDAAGNSSKGAGPKPEKH
jgi:hypothetical protein